MHEFSIAQNIVDIAEESAKKENCKNITAIYLDVGELSGVVFEALETAMNSAIKGSMMENAEVTINRIPGEAKCLDCKYKFALQDHFDPCPKCGAFRHDILAGSELKVKSIEAE